MSAPKRDRKPAATGLPPWDNAPTPPLDVFHDAAKVRPALVDEVKVGHLRNLLPMALDRITVLETELGNAAALLEQAATEVAAAERRRTVKREYQRDYRDGLRGSSAARAALRKGVQP